MAKTQPVTGTPEEQVRMLIAFDQFKLPASSMEGKLKRRAERYAESLVKLADARADFGNAIADVRYDEQMKARSLQAAVKKFCTDNPRAGSELQRVIDEGRARDEVYLTYGLKPGSRLSAGDYLAVMEDIGISGARAEALYPVLLDVSRDLQKARGRVDTTSEPREILVGQD